MSNNEVERLQTVYQDYRESQAIQAQWSEANAGNQAIMRERTRMLEQILQVNGFLPLTQHHILDVGCGTGRVLVSLRQWGATPKHLYGVDLLPDRITVAQNNFPKLHFQQANAEQLHFVDASFNLVLLFTVFTSILADPMARNLAGEVNRVLKPGGAVIWYDFRYNNPRNPHVRGMNQTSIQTLFPNFDLRLRTATLAPPLARRLGWATPVLYPVLAAIPWLRTHYLGLLIKPA